jgi:hypothetical protein
MEEIIYFHERNIRTDKKQMLHFTILPGNWPLWRSEILGKIVTYSSACNDAPCATKLYTF